MAKTFKLIDDRDGSEPLGGPLSEDNVYIRTYGIPIEDQKLIADLAVGESSICEYRLGGTRGVYRVLRIA